MTKYHRVPFRVPFKGFGFPFKGFYKVYEKRVLQEPAGMIKAWDLESRA